MPQSEIKIDNWDGDGLEEWNVAFDPLGPEEDLLAVFGNYRLRVIVKATRGPKHLDLLGKLSHLSPGCHPLLMFISLFQTFLRDS